MSTTTQHIGERDTPIVANPIEWDINREYEYLTIVIYNDDSYISKQDVPKSVQITNTKYWLKTNNYRAQIDQTIKKANSGIEKADEALAKFPVSIPNGGTGATTATDARSNLGLGNVENKSSATIRNELTKANVTSALGYTPSSSDNNTTYSFSQDSSDGHKLTLTSSDGTSKTVTVPDNDTKALGSMTGTLDISHGGTGKTTADEAWRALGGGNIGKKNSLAASDIPSDIDASKITGTLNISHGGTNATTAANARINLGLGNVENKSSATIRGELTKANVTSALGYTPLASDSNTTYSLSQDSSDGHKLTFAGSDGTSKTVIVPDNDTKALESMTGTLDISHGGTGETTAEEAWTALGGGSIGKKNSLTASDIPNLDASKIGSGTLGVARGGTGVTTAQAERKRLGLGDTTGAVPVANGGTGATTAADARTNLGLGNVENKSSATIRGELTKTNVTSALGYTPSASNTDTTYSFSQDSSDGHKLTLTSSDGTSKTVTIPDNDTKALGSMTGTLDISHGGTNATTAADARTNLGLGKVENKSSATIRGELTKANVTSALGYTPLASDSNTTYSLSQDSSDGHKLTLTSSDGVSKTVTIPDNDTKALGSMTGTLSIAHGGTGKTTAADAWTALGGGSVGKKNSLAASDIPSLDASKIGSGTLGVARGGTGAASAADARTNLGVTAANVVDNNTIKPSSVAATGTISSNTNIITGGALKPSSKSRSTSYVSGGKGNSALIYAEKETGKDFWYPAITIQTKGGGSWQIGNYADENLQFVYFDKTHLDANDNNGQLYLNITPSGIDPTYLSGTVPINKGGTGKTTAADAWTALGGGSIGKKNSLAASDIPSLSTDKLTSGTLPIARGGTNATTAADARTNLGLGNVENKSSATIRGELTKANVTSALGYTPPSSDTNTTYLLSQDTSNGHKLTFTGSDGTSKTITIPDNDTKALGSMTGTLSIAHGGTGKTTAADAWTALGGGSIGKKNSLAASDIPSLDASKIGSGTLSIARGGTGKTTAAEAWTALGGGSIGKKNSLAASDIPNLSTDKLTSGTLSIALGGTGASTAADAASNIVDGQVISPSSVSASGDVSGVSFISNNNIDSAASSRSAIHTCRYAQVRDVNDVEYAFMEAQKLTDGKVQNTLGIFRKINDVDKYGTLKVQMDNSGNVSWDITNPANFRSALGLGNTMGALPIASGGTGATTASNAVKSLTGKAWGFDTNNTSDTWVPVAATVNGVATWQHRAIPTNLATTPTSLWSGDTTGNITLSQTVANFTRVTIFFRDNDNVHSSVDVYSPLNKSVLLSTNWKGQFVKSRVVNLNGTQVNNYYYGQAGTVENSASDTNLIYITRVLGWKY